MLDRREKETIWSQKYRPSKVSELILPDRFKTQFQSMIDKGDIQNCLLVGLPGTGKTSAALAMVDELGLEHIMINMSENGNIDTLRTTIRSYASTMSMNGKKKIIICDEFDYSNCFNGDQEIFINDSNTTEKLSNLVDQKIKVVSYNFETKETEVVDAFCYQSGEKEVFEVELENGQKIYCTEDHPFFTEDGEEVYIDSLELFSIEM
jgi:hypothetical protein